MNDKPEPFASPFARHAWSPNELKAIVEAERRSQPFLAYRAPAGKQQIVDLSLNVKPVLTVGRGTECDVDLTGDDQVSRLHCVLECRGDQWVVEDLEFSRNGTFVNGARVRSRAHLVDRDVLSLGQTDLLFRRPHVSSSLATVTGVRTSGAPAAVTEAQQRGLLELVRPCIESGQF
ncbi:MAG: FHA domain-containing protein, partial [Actinomycetes bacterium]